MADPRFTVNTPAGRRIRKTALQRIYAEAEPKTQLDFFLDKEGVAQGALRQPRDADRLAEQAGIKLRPLIRKHR